MTAPTAHLWTLAQIHGVVVAHSCCDEVVHTRVVAVGLGDHRGDVGAASLGLAYGVAHLVDTK